MSHEVPDHRPITVVAGVIGVDAHVTGHWVVSQALKVDGITVVSLGVCVDQDQFVEAAVEAAADSIWVTSMYGHALLDCEGFRDKCIEAGIGHILLYLGGMLVVGKQEWEPVERQFREMGFDRVFPPNTLPEIGIRNLREDLRGRHQQEMQA